MKRIWLLTILIFSLGLILRLYKLGSSPISGDESISTIRALWLYRGIFSHHWIDFYGLIVHQHPPTELAIISLSFPLGFTEATIRFPCLLLNSLIPVIVIKYFRRFIGNSKLTLIAALLLAVSPMLIGWSKEAAYDNLVLVYSVILIYWLARFSLEPNRRNLIWLAVVYGFSFWVILFYGLLFPLTTFLIYQNRSKLKTRDLIRSAVIFFIVAGLYLIPYILGVYFVPASTGVRNLLARPIAWHPWINFQYYWTTYLSHPSVIIATVVLTYGLFRRKIREDKFYFISIIYVISYLGFFIFLYGKLSAYMSAIYPAMILGTIMVFKFLPRKLGYAIFIFWVGILLILSFQYQVQQHSDTEAIWGYSRSLEIQKAAYLIRECTGQKSLTVSDVDGFETSLYFNRRYPQIQDKVGLGKTLTSYLDQSVQAVYLSPTSEFKDNQWLAQKYLFSDGSVLYLRSCNLDIPKDNEQFYRKYWTVNNAIDFYR